MSIVLNKNIICTESSKKDFEVNKLYTVQEVRKEFCVKSNDNQFYQIFWLYYPNIKAKSLLSGDVVQFKFQKQESL